MNVVTPRRNRRPRLSRTLCLAVLALAAASSPSRAETLYNGIVLPAAWPPRIPAVTPEPQDTPPYLVAPPAVIPIDVGRQLFVDYFLIEKTDLRRRFHSVDFFEGNPVIRPEQPWEFQGMRGHSMAFSDGVWYDPAAHIFKAWYMSGDTTLYATSTDGVHWDKPALDVQAGTNIVHVHERDSSTVWLDQEEKDPGRRYKLVYYSKKNANLELFFSADGIHWGAAAAYSPHTGDRTTVFWNPFRRVWVASLRASSEAKEIVAGFPPKNDAQRIRDYFEHPDILGMMHWQAGQPVPWVGADRLDASRVDLNLRPELYNLDAAPYESLMIGLFSVWRGQPDRSRRDKPNEITVGFSRDGFHWDKPFRRALIPVSERPDAWNYGNSQSVGGCCLVVRDRLYFYMSGRATAPRTLPGADATGLATLRRDGFVSMDAGDAAGSLTTRPVLFHGKHLFVNVDSSEGELRVEVLDAHGAVLAPFSADNCRPVRVDNTLQAVTWEGAGDLSALSGTPVRFRFHLRAGQLYSFWVSPDQSGASHGYVAAGGPGFTGTTDTVGLGVYEHAWVPKKLN